LDSQYKYLVLLPNQTFWIIVGAIMALKPLGSTAAVIDVLGGSQKVQRLLDAKPTAVSNWRTLGRFPSWTYPEITPALAALGYCVRRSLFGGLTERVRRRQRRKNRTASKDEPREGARSSA
jgi:hypothetical protein